MKIIFSKDVPIIFMYSLNYFDDEYEVRGSRFGHIFGRSKNVPENIAIDQESWIRHFGIIKKTQNPIIILKNKENTKQLYISLPYF